MERLGRHDGCYLENIQFPEEHHPSSEYIPAEIRGGENPSHEKHKSARKSVSRRG